MGSQLSLSSLKRRRKQAKVNQNNSLQKAQQQECKISKNQRHQMQEEIPVVNVHERKILIKGLGRNGCLGLSGQLANQYEFTQMVDNNSDMSITDLQLGWFFVLAIVDYGKSEEQKQQLVRWGKFQNNIITHPQILSLPLKTTIQKISCGVNHALVKTNQGLLMGIGQNLNGQLGSHNDKQFYDQLVYVTDMQAKVDVIAAGDRISFWTDTNKNVHMASTLPEYMNYTLHQYNNLMKKQDQKIIKICCGFDFALFLDSLNQVWAIGNNHDNCLSKTRQQFTRLTEVIDNIKDIACGWKHTVMLNMQGKVLTQGNWMAGQLGRRQRKQQRGHDFVPINQPCVSVHAGLNYNYAVTQSGMLYGWGSNKWRALSHSQQEEILWEPMPIEYPKGYKIEKLKTNNYVTALILAPQQCTNIMKQYQTDIKQYKKFEIPKQQMIVYKS